MATSLKNLSDYDASKVSSAEDMKFGIVVAEWNPEITNALLEGAVKSLLKHNAKEEDIYIKHVPGSYELPLGAQLFLEDTDVDAVIILGCVIQGETRHFDFICDAVGQGVMKLSLDYITPVIFGLLTTNNQQQAIDRAGGKHGNKGDEAAITAIKMVDLVKSSSK